MAQRRHKDGVPHSSWGCSGAALEPLWSRSEAALKPLYSATGDVHTFGFPANFDHAETVYRALDGFGLKDYFCDIFISDAIGWRKPGRKFFEIVLEKTQHDPKRCLYVGDDVVADVLGATRAGFQVAWLMGKSQIEKPARAPRWIVSDLQEIVGIVKGSN